MLSDDDAQFSQMYGAINTSPSGDCPEDEDLLRRRLKYFFLSPCQKWQAKRKVPWKMMLQLTKIVLVTIQLAIFGVSRSSHVDFMEKSSISFKHLYLKDWSSELETMPYPPAAGAFAVYTHEGFYSSVNYAMERYDETEKLAMGTYQFTRESKSSKIPRMEMCCTHYRLSKNWVHNQSYEFDAMQETDCFPVSYIHEYDNKTGEHHKVYNITRYLEIHNRSINFDGLVKAVLKFNLTAIHLKFLSRLSSPDCYLFYIQIEYDNSHHDGQMVIALKVSEVPLPCFGEIYYDGGWSSEAILSTLFDVIVIIISMLSLILCVRSLIKGHTLKMRTVRFFKSRYSRDLTANERLEFLNLWYVLIVINDVLTMVGSGYKIAIENKLSYNYEVCSLLLGTSSLFVWFGVLRYLGFFHKYNLLILTLKKSAPSIFRFLVCAGVFYFGFTICGWVVLGPYHIKFRELHSASACLFSLVNGDDMYVTFAAISPNSYVWWYSMVYLYTFISLFIYVILSVFISVIMDTYETIKHCNQHGFPKSIIEEFIDQCSDDAYTLFRSVSTEQRLRSRDCGTSSCLHGCLSAFCCNKEEQNNEDESTNLIS